MDNIMTDEINGSSHKSQNKAPATSPIYKLAKGKRRWLLLIGIEPLEDESGNIVYHCINGYDIFI